MSRGESLGLFHFNREFLLRNALICAFVGDRLRNLLLTPHGVDGDNASLKLKESEEFRNSGNLIRLLSGLYLT